MVISVVLTLFYLPSHVVGYSNLADLLSGKVKSSRCRELKILASASTDSSSDSWYPPLALPPIPEQSALTNKVANIETTVTLYCLK